MLAQKRAMLSSETGSRKATFGAAHRRAPSSIELIDSTIAIIAAESAGPKVCFPPRRESSLRPPKKATVKGAIVRASTVQPSMVRALLMG